eukprot:scaffold6450_cov415-Prasinococcus_capsulatus_cf.AAC.7
MACTDIAGVFGTAPAGLACRLAPVAEAPPAGFFMPKAKPSAGLTASFGWELLRVKGFGLVAELSSVAEARQGRVSDSSCSLTGSFHRPRTWAMKLPSLAKLFPPSPMVRQPWISLSLSLSLSLRCEPHALATSFGGEAQPRPRRTVRVRASPADQSAPHFHSVRAVWRRLALQGCPLVLAPARGRPPTAVVLPPRRWDSRERAGTPTAVALSPAARRSSVTCRRARKLLMLQPGGRKIRCAPSPPPLPQAPRPQPRPPDPGRSPVMAALAPGRLGPRNDARMQPGEVMRMLLLGR